MESKVDIGRIGENIATNELLARGFLVTHLDKGTRGVSANADLLVGHERLERPVLIQVKSCVWERLDCAFMGAFHSDGKLYNRKPGFKADFIISVTVKSPTEYRVFCLKVSKIEKMLIEAYDQFHKLPKRDGGAKKPVATMYVKLTDRDTVAGGTFISVGRTIAAGENNFDALLTGK